MIFIQSSTSVETNRNIVLWERNIFSVSSSLVLSLVTFIHVPLCCYIFCVRLLLTSGVVSNSFITYLPLMLCMFQNLTMVGYLFFNFFYRFLFIEHKKSSKHQHDDHHSNQLGSFHYNIPYEIDLGYINRLFTKVYHRPRHLYPQCDQNTPNSYMFR